MASGKSTVGTWGKVPKARDPVPELRALALLGDIAIRFTGMHHSSDTENKV